MHFTRHVPSQDLPIGVPAEEGLSIGGVSKAGDFRLVAPKLPHAPLRREVPNENGLVPARGGEEFAIRRKRQGGSPDVAAIEAAQDFSAGIFQEPDLALPIGGGGYSTVAGYDRSINVLGGGVRFDSFKTHGVPPFDLVGAPVAEAHQEPRPVRRPAPGGTTRPH